MKNIKSKPVSWRKKLEKSVGEFERVTAQQQEEFLTFLPGHHSVFALEEYERGETKLVEMDINTGDAHPCRSPPPEEYRLR